MRWLVALVLLAVVSALIGGCATANPMKVGEWCRPGEEDFWITHPK